MYSPPDCLGYTDDVVGKRILCIDDNEEIRNLLKETLTQAGHEVSLAKDGVEGLAIAMQKSFDLIITDVMMPKVDGYDVCEQLRKNPMTKNTPVLVSSARTTSLTERTAKIFGADAYLSKPFKLAELLTLVTQLTSTRS